MLHLILCNFIKCSCCCKMKNAVPFQWFFVLNIIVIPIVLLIFFVFVCLCICFTLLHRNTPKEDQILTNNHTNTAIDQVQLYDVNGNSTDRSEEHQYDAPPEEHHYEEPPSEDRSEEHHYEEPPCEYKSPNNRELTQYETTLVASVSCIELIHKQPIKTSSNRWIDQAL